MPLVDVDDLAEVLDVSRENARLESSIAVAEALCAAHVGVDTLELTERTETITPVRDKTTIELRYGPLTALTSIVGPDGEQVGDSVNLLTTDHWAVAVQDGFSGGSEYELEYSTGWTPVCDGPADVPALVKQAILIVASAVFNRGAAGGMKSSERIGDYAVTYADPKTGVSALVPLDAAVLLRQYRRPGL